VVKRLRTYLALAAAEVSTRTSIVKVKINGRCVNRCCFCPFHSDPHLLEADDLTRLFDMIERPRFHRIDINGGEPTLHPRFAEIAALLRQRFGGRVVLHLGSNLIPLAPRGPRARRRLQVALDGFDMLSVGCDDEHRNVHCLEQLAPEIVGSGRLLCVNVMEQYCSADTRRRILAVRDRVGMRVSFSQVHHFYAERPRPNDTSVPCRHRTRELLVNCNGDAFFCFHQEMEAPLFNLHTVTRDALNWYLNDYLPEPYRFCAACPCYSTGLADRVRTRVRLPRWQTAATPHTRSTAEAP
jgi:hypothetical protein